ncbi:MAG: hypothetical protein EOP56_18610 [Sphingobacteriales bacterium]|nr:MAG: hypothetical protein EOP56_18610 [Sphingobacteriales bacterium]
MSFLYPFFLVAGLLLAIPVLIHLFNLRRYKTVYFPHTRFLKNIQLKSQKQSQIRHKLLLALRMLFLATLILAFAQPFFMGDKKAETSKNLQVIYLDNSASMSVKKGARSLLEVAKDAARQQVRQAPQGSRIVLLTNDKPVSYQPLPADKVLTAINGTDISSATKTSNQVWATVQSIVQNESMDGADVYYYSDFQRNAFSQARDKNLMDKINFIGVPIQANTVQNIYIDTAYLNSPVLQTGQSNQLIVHTRAVGKLPAEMPVMQLSINGQVKSATSLNFNDKNEGIDTLAFHVNDAGWQRMTLALNDAAVRFDDTFMITARSAPNLSILVLNEGQTNPYIQAAFRAYNGFRLNQVPAAQAPGDLQEYNLIILNGITRIDDAMAGTIAKALNQGQSICIFPGRTDNVAGLNEGLRKLGDISISGIETEVQPASTLQQGSNLVKDLFERVPENVQLPVANWHYIIDAGLTANQQAILSFRNGDPFLAKYTPSRGQLYITATSADLTGGNFPGSYFFVPFLYQMAMQSRGGDVYAITAGKQQPVYLPLNNADERNMIHLYARGIDAIPPQRPSGAGLEVFADQVISQSGFYTLASTQGGDTTAIALNQDRTESSLDLWNISNLKDQWKGKGIKWMDVNRAAVANSTVNSASFPLWKVCVILALLMLAAETFVLAGSLRKPTAAAQ